MSPSPSTIYLYEWKVGWLKKNWEQYISADVIYGSAIVTKAVNMSSLHNLLSAQLGSQKFNCSLDILMS